jgi:hypothetical protein
MTRRLVLESEDLIVPTEPGYSFKLNDMIHA